MINTVAYFKSNLPRLNQERINRFIICGGVLITAFLLVTAWGRFFNQAIFVFGSMACLLTEFAVCIVMLILISSFPLQFRVAIYCRRHSRTWREWREKMVVYNALIQSKDFFELGMMQQANCCAERAKIKGDLVRVYYDQMQ